jgi:hypothetical protein
MAVKLTSAGVLPLVLWVGLVAGAPAANAALGGAYDSVQADRAHFAASLKSTAAATYTVHTLTLQNGGGVKEFARPDGTVFAVSWRGPGRPDLRQLLGGYFDTMQAENGARAGPRHRRPLTVNHPDFVVESGGHSGAFWGLAMLPGTAPSGFSASDLR